MSPIIFSFCYIIDYYISKILGNSITIWLIWGGAGNSIPKDFIMNLFLYHNKMLWLIQYLQLQVVKSKRPEGNNWPSVFTVECKLHSLPSREAALAHIDAALLVLRGYFILSFSAGRVQSNTLMLIALSKIKLTYFHCFHNGWV